MTLSTRLTIAMGALVVIASSAVGLVMYREVVAVAEPRGLERIASHAREIATEIDVAVSRVRADVLGFRAAVAVSDIMTARLNNESDASLRQRLARRFEAELQAKPDFSQFRVIAADDGGREIVRVDRSGPAGAIRVVPDDELQAKADRPYFLEAISLPAGAVYISPVDLNQENGVIETPHVPTLRVSAPIVAPDGKPFGVVVINLDFRSIFNRLRAYGSDSSVYVVNERGDYLFHPNPAREFGFQLGTPFRIQDDFPELTNDLKAPDPVSRVVANRDGDRFGLGAHPLQLAGGSRITVVEALPYDQMLAAAVVLRNTGLAGGLAMLLATVIITILLARSMTKPLVQMTRAAEGLARGETIEVPTDASGEIGVLAKAFKRMAADVRASAEALKHENEERRRFFETSPDLILITDRRGQFMGVNPTSSAILGYRPEEMIGHSGIEFIYSDDLDRTRNEMRAARNGQEIRNFETRYVHKDGRIVTLDWSGVWSELEQRHFFIGRDNTERRRLQLAERETKEMLSAVIDASPVAIVCLAPDRTVMLWNRAAEQIFGYTAAETVGERYKLVPAGQEAEFEILVDRALAGESFRDQRVQRRRKDGTFAEISFSGAAIHGPDGEVRGIAYALTDITESNRLEQQLRQAQKTEAIGQLTGGIAHDFNNMLTVITGTIDILAESVADKPEIAAIARLISEAAERGAELTGRLLAFARRQPLQPREIDVNELATDAARLLRPTLGEHIDVEWKLHHDVWPALVDPAQLVTALVNLAVNARDAMPGGGKLTIETSNVVLDEVYADAHSEVAAGAYAMIAVSDTGSGIPESERDKVFDPFFTTKDVGKGTGLGLSMVYGFVKQSGGHIKLYSEVGHGTTFKIYLPRAGAAAGALTESVAPQIEGGHETILVVEDDPIVRHSVTVQLESLGYTVIVATNAQEALVMIDRGAVFDLLFTDVIMPGVMNGRRLAEEATKRRPSLKVVFTSGYTEDAIVHHGRLDPGVLLLPKPYRKPDLARMIRRALSQVGNGLTLPGALPMFASGRK